MKNPLLIISFLLGILLVVATSDAIEKTGQDGTRSTVDSDTKPVSDPHQPSLDEVKQSGRLKSVFLKRASRRPITTDAPVANLADFKSLVEPALKRTCVNCHGPKNQSGDFRVDTLNPNLLLGGDVDWWLEVYDVLSNGEMPPKDSKYKLEDEIRSRMIDWLASEIQLASDVRRSKQKHSSFRRMAKYEFNYALQDLLGLPYDFARDLPPETASEDGFKNSSEMLHMSAMQIESYRNTF